MFLTYGTVWMNMYLFLNRIHVIEGVHTVVISNLEMMHS